MSNKQESGIVAQYGFLYQRKAFVLFVLQNINVKQNFTFEGCDDIDVSSDEGIWKINVSSGGCVQVKSGHVSEECFSRIICNWLLLDVKEDFFFALMVENDLSFNFASKERATQICEYIKKGKDKKISSIARKVYEKYKERMLSEPSCILDDAERLITNFEKKVIAMDEIDSILFTQFNNHYCQDINDYEIAKTKRLERFLSLINTMIDNAIKNKKAFVLVYSQVVQLVMQVKEEISDKKYSVDIKLLKEKSKEDAQQIVNERVSREVEQLFLVDRNEGFVVDGIVQELIYKDFRETFEKKKELAISNIEENAKANFESAKFSLEKESINPRNLYKSTTEQEIENDLMPRGRIYRTGCYIYLTSDDVNEDIQITWGENNDSG